MFKNLIQFFYELFVSLHFTEYQSVLFSESATFISLLVFAVITYYLSWFIIKRTVIIFIQRSDNHFDDILLKNRVISRFSYFVPSFIISKFAPSSLPSFPDAFATVQKTIEIYVIFVAMLVISAIISSLYDFYNTLDVSKNKPVKGLAQILKLVVFIVGGLMILATLMNQNLANLVIGLGTLSAVLMLVFKDPILGFVGGIQLSLNDMVRIGDWISMPKYNADGDVLEITLTTVKVQNFDKTITTIPTYALVSDSFTNWRGMSESGGRRVKRNISIDMETVRFCSQEMIEKFKQFHLIEAYIHQKEMEIADFNQLHQIDASTMVNGRRQTNLGVFRAYLKAYLQSHPLVHNEMPVLVRQLQSSDKGIPMEVYFFSSRQAWTEYEDLQSDVFDHVLAVIPLFGLRVFQQPSGGSIEKATLLMKDYKEIQ
ncbi:MAG: miniconductance mechanosensitive channel [Bacteroidetes bacterium]|nr:MAG: miniconductance mechanosensitive channel [Bacteroidota bacterium]